MPLDLSIFVSCQPIFTRGRPGTPFSIDGVRTYVQPYRVVVNTQYADSTIVCQHPDIPKPLQFYDPPDGEPDFLARVIKLDADLENKDDWQSWIVNATFSTQLPDGPFESGFPQQKKTGADNPELEPPHIEWDFQENNKAKKFDLDNNLICNSAGDPFTLPFEDAYAVLAITRKQLKFDSTVAEKWAYAVNSDTFLGRPPGTCQCLPPKAIARWRGPVGYWEVSYRIRMKRLKQTTTKKGDPKNPKLDDPQEFWQPRVVDEGFHILKPLSDGTPAAYPIRFHGKEVRVPQFLNGQGQLAPRDVVDNPWFPKANPKLKIVVPSPVYRDIKLYPARAFKDLLVKGIA